MKGTYRKHRGGAFRAPLSYVDTSYSQPSSGAGSDMLGASGQIVRPSMSVMTGGCGCGGMPAPIAARNIARNEPLYPAIHSRLIGGSKRKSKTRKHMQRGGCGCSGNPIAQLVGGKHTQKAGFSPAIIGPLVDNFHYIAPAVGLVAYRYYDQIKSKKRSRKHNKRAHKK
jgi:hypothetical protein